MFDHTAILLAAHGCAKNPLVNQGMYEIADQIERQLGTATVYPAFLDGRPDIRTIATCLTERQILVIPFMASQGYYTDVVFPEVLQRTDREVAFLPPIGMHFKLAQLVQARLLQLLCQLDNRSSVTVLVVGHGTRRNKNSCRTTIGLTEYLKARHTGLAIQFAFIDQNPCLQQVANKIDSEWIIVIPFLMCLGPHMTKDVPQAFGLGDLTNHLLNPQTVFPWVQSISVADKSRTICLDMPIGTYPQWASISVAMIKNYLADQQTAVGQWEFV